MDAVEIATYISWLACLNKPNLTVETGLEANAHSWNTHFSNCTRNAHKPYARQVLGVGLSTEATRLLNSVKSGVTRALR